MTDLDAAAIEWRPWIVELCEAVGVDADLVNVQEIHGLTQVVAREFLRPMAPVAATIWGVARAQQPSADPEALREAILAAMAEPSVEFDAVILAGGKGSRLGGTDKATLEIGGETLLDRALQACAGARTRVVVGPVEAPAGVIVTREDPPGTGPAAGLAAGLEAIDGPSEWTLALACDLPGASLAVPLLLEAAGDGDAYCIAHADGGHEWLLALYRSSALREAVTAHGDPRNRSVGSMVGKLDIELVPGPGASNMEDIDTWEDHARWSARLTDQGEDRSQWRPFIRRASAGVGVDANVIVEDTVLDMTRAVAHAGARPMSAITAFILGLAAGQGAGQAEVRATVEEHARRSIPS